MGFSIPYFNLIQKSIPAALASAQTSQLTDWLTDYQTKLINEWLNEQTSLFNALLICHREWGNKRKKGKFLRSPDFKVPTKDLMIEFLLLSLESACMIPIRALRAMQLIRNEENMLRWQTHDCNVWRHVNPWAYSS